MRYIIYILIALAVVGVVLFVKRRGMPTVTRDSLQQAMEKGEPLLLLDVRSRPEFDSGHIPGAVNLPHDRVAGAPGEVSADKAGRIVVYCERGPRAMMAQQALLSAGYTDVSRLMGDMSGWRSIGLPVEK